MEINGTYRIDIDGTLLVNDTPHIHRKGILNAIAVHTFAIADELDTLEQFGLLDSGSDMKKAIRLFYCELEREHGIG
ncbi:MAG: hypothetical protein JXR40_03865 [Pontiellaceae bacterium]|nr:hypothetical protein [Pontiellaceae bacterium]